MISFSSSAKSTFPNLRLGCIECTIEVQKDNTTLWEEINLATKELELKLDTPDISTLPAIQSTRQAYKAAGKDPARYRPASEALLRRVVKGKGLYQVNNVVDLLNLVSIRSGYSICGYDVSLIQGDIELGIGKEGEPYEGIGRGVLNIQNLPVFRDEVGAFGTPTSDSTRTMVRASTTRFLMIFLDFGSHSHLEYSMAEAVDLLINYAGGKDFKEQIIK